MTQPAGGLLCPACRVDLVMSERSGVEIDYCPKCRGVWLDRGELDKILERAGAEMKGPAGSSGMSGEQQRSHVKHDSDEYPAYGHKGYRKRRSFLDDLFD
jgi:Zn-finger nucleic acid-binding protein